VTATASRRSDWGLIARLLRDARACWPHIVGLFALGLMSVPLALLVPLPLKIAVDNVLAGHPVSPFVNAFLPGEPTPSSILIAAVALSLTLALLSQLQGFATSVLRTYTGEKLVLAFRADLFRRAQRLSLRYHDSKGTADSGYRIQYDAPAIQWIAIDGLIPLVTAALTLLGMILIILRLDRQLAVVALAVCPILFLLSRVYARQLRQQWSSVKELESSALSVVQEVLSAVRVVKAFGQEDREQTRFLERARASFRQRTRTAAAEGRLGVLIGLTLAAGGAAVLFLGIQHARAGRLTLGELLVVMTYLSQLYAPLSALSKKAAGLQGSLASAERAYALLDGEADVIERAGARPLARAAGGIEFRNVSFSYEAGRPVLRDLSFEVRPGARVGIFGPTGAGKTTLVSLLSRFYDPTGGEILLDGIDLRDYRLADLREQFAIVLQEPVLFSTSIAENIAYARPEASDQEVVEAARAAGVHEFVSRLPDGYETQVGERGMRLSGGERQRVSLARAFLKDAPILVLDEPTSSVDVATESAILDTLERLMEGRTTITIAHRRTTLKRCDAWLEIEEGRLVGSRPAAAAAEGP
jgi:ATP-binding cassette subfamily B protein